MIELPGGALVDIPETTLEVGAVTIHEHKAPARTIERWKNKDKFRALQRTYLPEIREAENALWLVWVSRFVDYAQGESLDLLGRIVGELRNGRTDANYRLRIKARILINKSFGRVDDIALMLQAIEPTTAVIFEGAPAFIRVDFDGPLQGNALLGEIAQLVSEARAAGVGASVVAPTDEDLGLRWSTTTDPFRKFNYTVGVFSDILGSPNDLVTAVGVGNTVEAGCLLCLQVCDEDGYDYPTPSGWTLQGNQLLNNVGPARHKLWTRVHPGGDTLVSVNKPSGAGRAIAKMMAVRAPALAVGASVDTYYGTGTLIASSFGAGQLPTPFWALSFSGFDSGGTLGAYGGAGSTHWDLVYTEAAGSAAGGVGVACQFYSKDSGGAPAVQTGTLTNTAPWGVIAISVGPRVLGGWNYGLLADRRRA